MRSLAKGLALCRRMERPRSLAKAGIGTMRSRPALPRRTSGLCRAVATAAICAALVSGCTTRADIDYVKTHTAELKAELVPIATVGSVLGTKIKDGAEVFLVEVSSATDLSEPVIRKEMAFLYYRLWTCGAEDGDADLLRGPVYASHKPQDRGPYGYFAAIPWDYDAAIARHREVFRLEPAPYGRDVCLSLGAGNMAGQRVVTNRVRFTLPPQP